MKKRIFALLLTLSMLLSMVVLPVAAEESTENSKITPTLNIVSCEIKDGAFDSKNVKELTTINAGDLFALEIGLENATNEQINVQSYQLYIELNNQLVSLTERIKNPAISGLGGMSMAHIEGNMLSVSEASYQSTAIRANSRLVLGYVLLEANENAETSKLTFKVTGNENKIKDDKNEAMPDVSFDNVSVTIPVDGTDPVLDYAVIYSKDAVTGVLVEIGWTKGGSHSNAQVAQVTVDGVTDQEVYLRAFSKMGTDITSQVDFTWEGTPGFTLDKTNGVPYKLTIDKTSKARVTIVHAKQDEIDYWLQINVNHTNITPTTVTISSTEEGAIKIPVGDAVNERKFTANVKDQFGEPYDGDPLGYTWSISPAVTGVTIEDADRTTATLKVTSAAYEHSGDYTLTCTVKSANATVPGTTTVSIQPETERPTSIEVGGPDDVSRILPGIGEEKTIKISAARILNQYGKGYGQGTTGSSYPFITDPNSYKLYEVTVDATTKEVTRGADVTQYAKFEEDQNESSSSILMNLTLTNAKLADGNLALREGKDYAIYVNAEGIEAHSTPFRLTPADPVPTTVTLKVQGANNSELEGNTIEIPKKTTAETTDPEKTIIYLAIDTITDQYGELITDTQDYSLSGDVTLQLDGAAVGSDKLSVIVDGGRLKVTVKSKLAKSYPLTGGAAQALTDITGLTLKKGGTEVTGVTFTNPTLTFTQDPEFKTSKITVKVGDRTTQIDSSAPQTITIRPDGTNKTLTFKAYDQYDREYAVKGNKSWIISAQYTTGVWSYNNDDGSYTVDASTANNGESATFSFPARSADAWTVKVLIKDLEFVNSDGDTYDIDDMLTDTTTEYAHANWSSVINQLTPQNKSYVYIKNVSGPATLITDTNNFLRTEITDENGKAVYSAGVNNTGKNEIATAGTYTVTLYYRESTVYHEVCHGTFTVTPKTLTVSYHGGVTKVYDGTTDVTTSGENPVIDLNQFQFEDGITKIYGVTVASATFTYNSKDVETASTVTMDDVTLSNPNYTIATPLTLNASISPKPVTVTVTATKQWDGTANDCQTHDFLVKPDDLVGGDTVSANLKGPKTYSFKASSESGKANSDVGAMLDVIPADIDLNNSNYTVGIVNVEGGITQATLHVVESMQSNSIVLDYGDKTRTEALALSSYTIQNGNNVTISADKFAAVSSFDLWKDGSKYSGDLNVGNYRMELTATANYANFVVQLYVFAKEIIVSADGTITKEYDGTTNLPDNAPLKIDGSGAYGEVLTIDKSMLEYVSKDAGQNIRIQFKRGIDNCFKIGDAVASNYAPNLDGLTGTINKKYISGATVTLENDSLPYNGTAQSPRITSVTIDGLALGAGDYTSSRGTALATPAGSYTLYVDGKGNFTGEKPVNWSITKAAAGSALNDPTNLKATRNKVNTITLTLNYPITTTPTIECTAGQSTWLKAAPTVATGTDGKTLTITLDVKDGTVTDDSKITLKLTIPTDGKNYEQTEKTFDVQIINKLTQYPRFEAGTYVVEYAAGTHLAEVRDARTTPVTYSSSDPTIASVDSTSGLVTIHDVTDDTLVTITATAAEDATYASATATYRLQIKPSQLTVTAGSATMTAGEAVPAVSASVSGLRSGETTSQVFQTLTATVNTDGKTVGTYATVASATLKDTYKNRYELHFVNGTLTVNPAMSIIDTVLPGLIMGNTCANGYANCACETFHDLDASRWYHDAVDWAYNLGLMNGTTKNTFSPNAAASRAQTWTMLARIAGQDTGRSSTWYEVGQTWATAQGITDGTNPLGTLTREQLAAMLYRYVGSPAVRGSLGFADSANVSSWATDAMVWAVQNGILDGVGNNRLNPKGTTTRAQAAAIFMRFSKLIGK